ncbi:EamA family transporter [Actinomadura craniellae]|uniref:EamA family transporter n=1 Tax=Actinomadura craniellae TaxID=2231787 RepID=A0A365H5J7_9ACTN|nr:DMT family transporter [Actinomadura craniellae]RAY14380.1 EamA family transporter [Actinomadura craniellae]
MTSSTSPRGVFGAAAAMLFVGTLTAISDVIGDYPILGGQALRYTTAALIMLAVARALGPLPRPRPRDWVLLTALAVTGLAAFNVCVIVAAERSGPVAVGMMIAAAPVVLALAGPLVGGSPGRRRPAPRVLAGAVLVSLGAALANGLSGGGALGTAAAVGALAGEVCFSLLAVPLLPRLGPVVLTAYTTALAAPLLAVTGLAIDGGAVLRVPTPQEAAGLAYLAVIVTTVAFFLWYDALGRIGADRAGLFGGLVPLSALATATALGLAGPGAADLAGAALVVGGLLVGLSRPRAAPAPSPPAGGRVPAAAGGGRRTL